VVRYDHGAAGAAGPEREPYRGEAELFSLVERKVGNCSEPVIRARATGGGVIISEPVAPIDR
jgi:hypothetical protein